MPDISSLDALCNALDVSVNELLSGEVLPSYSVKPKSIDFTGFDDIYLPQNKSRK